VSKKKPASYILRVVDRGAPKGVPVVDVYLLRIDGGCEACVMHSADLGLSPKSVEELAAYFGGLGVRVEREARPLPADPNDPNDPKADPKAGG